MVVFDASIVLFRLVESVRRYVRFWPTTCVGLDFLPPRNAASESAFVRSSHVLDFNFTAQRLLLRRWVKNLYYNQFFFYLLEH